MIDLVAKLSHKTSQNEGQEHYRLNYNQIASYLVLAAKVFQN